jgi:polyphosphate glucokinase
MKALGIDIGGSGIKAAIIDTLCGKLVSERHRLSTPVPATPKAVAAVIAQMKQHFVWKGPIGCGIPGPIKGGRIMVMTNLDSSWVGVKAHEVFAKVCGKKVAVLNDADAAGLAEMTFGAGKDKAGVVVVLTLGEIEIRGKKGELRAAARVRKEKDLSWQEWAAALNEYLQSLEQLLWPDLIIIGGGVSKRSKKFIPLLKLRARVVPAKLQNEAGIIGAGLFACLK